MTISVDNTRAIDVQNGAVAKARKRLLLRAKIVENGEAGQPITVVGRDAWCLKELLAAGQRGITSLQNPAPRLGHYIWKLRRFGFAIETTHENHAGDYPGHHARYRLHSEVVLSESEVA
ncbi:hypothetical protein [Ensifer sp. Root1252]|uniref:winged helix domain-containing protein n=1 Tax=unclassified Ensifer TaxID=2633371 RepID=UPI003242FB87